MTIWRTVEGESVNWSDFANNSRDLERFRLRDFGSVRSTLETFYVPTKRDFMLFPLPLVSRVSKDLAKHYLLPAGREWSDGTPTALLDVLAQLEWDRWMLGLHEQLIPQQSVLVTCLPGAGRAPMLPRLQRWLPYEASVLPGADVLAEDLRDAQEVRLRWPIGGRMIDQGPDTRAIWQAVYGQAVFTSTECYVTNERGEKVGLWDPERPEDTTHPLGYLPVVGVRVSEPIKGLWFPSVCEDMREIQIGLILALSDILHTAKYQSHGQPVLTGPGAQAVASSLPTGAGAIWCFDTNKGGGSSANDMRFEYVVSNPPLEKYLSALETTLRYFGRFNYMGDDVLANSNVLTGTGVRELTQSAREERMRTAGVLESAERRILDLLCDVANASPRRIAPLSQPGRLSVEYRYPMAPENGLQEQQASALAFSLGTDAASLAVAREHGVSREEALKMVRENLKEHAELTRARMAATPEQAPTASGDGTPGLDRIAEQQTDLSAPTPERPA